MIIKTCSTVAVMLVIAALVVGCFVNQLALAHAARPARCMAPIAFAMT